MVMSQNMIFFDINYLKKENYISDVFLNTSTLGYGTDNRSDTGLISFSTLSGQLAYTIPAGSYVDTIMILNHNCDAIRFYLYTTTTATNLANFTFTALAGADFKITISNTLAYRFGIVNIATVNSNPLYFGEIILTKKKFQLSDNPSVYSPSMRSNNIVNQLYDGRTQFSEIRKNFSANIGWDYLVGSMDSMTGTDLQNMTELCRQKVSFLFYPNGGNTGTGNYPDTYGWRPQDIFKCRILDDTTYTYPIRGRLDVLSANYTLGECI